MPDQLHSTHATVEYSNNDKYSVFTGMNLILQKARQYGTCQDPYPIIRNDAPR